MKIFSLFSGIGGFDLAAQRCGHEIIGACEIDRYARAVYARHFPGIRIWEDATKISPEELPDFDLLAAGFPCQAFSIAGKRLGFEDSRGEGIFEIARIAQKKRPRYLLLENVPGLLSHDGGRTFGTVLRTLDEIGYDAQWQVVDAKYFLPQTRPRLFIVGHLRGRSRPEIFPIPEEHKFGDKACKGGTRMMIMTGNTGGNIKRRIQERDTTWTITRNPSTLIFEPGLKSVIKSDSFPYRVYDSSAISRTIISKGGGMGAKTGLYTVPIQKDVSDINERGIYDGQHIRTLTPLECERLQGFSDKWTDMHDMSDRKRYEMIGNAVPVPIVKWIMERLK